jgi:hypothetical protein
MVSSKDNLPEQKQISSTTALHFVNVYLMTLAALFGPFLRKVLRF